MLTLRSAQNFDTYICAGGMLAVVLRKRRGFVLRTGTTWRFSHASDGHLQCGGRTCVRAWGGVTDRFLHASDGHLQCDGGTCDRPLSRACDGHFATFRKATVALRESQSGRAHTDIHTTAGSIREMQASLDGK